VPEKTLQPHLIEFLSVEVAPVQGPSGKEPPKEILLFKKGSIKVKKIGVASTPDFQFTDRSFEEVIANSKDWGVRHSMDWEHTALNKALGAVAPGDGRAPAACWYDLEARPDGLYATNIEWTEQGAKDVLGKEYRYISPAFDFDPETREVTYLINASLTNLPATKGMTPIMASIHGEGANKEGASTMLKPALGILGLADTTSESEALARLSQLHTFRATILAQTGKASESEAIAALSALKTAETKATSMAAELEALRATTAKSEVENLLASGERDGKIEPGSSMRTFLASLPAEGIKAFLASAAVIKPGQHKPAKSEKAGTVDAGPAQLSAAQKAAVARMAPLFELKPEDVEKSWNASLNAPAPSRE